MPTVGHLERFAVGINTRNVDRAMSEISIDADELVRLTLDICNIESPAGKEAEVGAFVFDWMRREGFVRASEIYARVAIDVCGRDKPMHSYQRRPS